MHIQFQPIFCSSSYSFILHIAYMRSVIDYIVARVVFRCRQRCASEPENTPPAPLLKHIPTILRIVQTIFYCPCPYHLSSHLPFLFFVHRPLPSSLFPFLQLCIFSNNLMMFYVAHAKRSRIILFPISHFTTYYLSTMFNSF